MSTALEREVDLRGNGAGNGTGGRLGTAIRADMRPQPERTRPYQQLADSDRGTGGQTDANLLGYFGVGLGLAELLAPHAMAKLVGVRRPDDRTLNTMRLMGARELASGVAILMSEEPAPAVWGRVAGDALDLGLLAKTWSNPRNHRGRTLFAVANVLAVAALDLMTARQLSRQPDTRVTELGHEGIIQTTSTVTVNRPVSEVYAFWRDFQNFPRFMRHLVSVTLTGDGRSHWVAHAPAGKTVEWDAEITDDRPNELIAWRSLPDSQIYNSGTVRFRPAPGNRGTEVRVLLDYDPPGGKLGSKLAMLWREEPGQQVQDALRHFKQVMETGEVLVSDATKRYGMHPGVPDTQPVQR